MRDKNRIRPFLDKLGDYWEKVQDWRFGQFMVNFLNSLPRDPFFIEEDEMLEELEKFFEEKEK